MRAGLIVKVRPGEGLRMPEQPLSDLVGESLRFQLRRGTGLQDHQTLRPSEGGCFHRQRTPRIRRTSPAAWTAMGDIGKAAYVMGADPRAASAATRSGNLTVRNWRTSGRGARGGDR